MAARLTCLALALGAVVFSALAFGQGTGNRRPEASAGYRVQRSANGPTGSRFPVWRSDKAGSILRLARQILGRLEGPASLAP